MESDCEKQSKKSKSKLWEQNDLSRNAIDSLPHETTLDILSRLPAPSLIRCWSVCQSWNLLSRNPHLLNLHSSQAVNENPCLIFHCDYPIQNYLYFVELSNIDEKETVRKIHTPFASSMPKFDVVGSSNGLLCLKDSLHNVPLYIYNPFTKDYKELPKPRRFQGEEMVFGFGYHPISSEHKVVKISYLRNWYYGLHHTRSEVQVFTLGSNAWKSVGEIPYRLEKRSLEASLVNGRLHWVSRPGRYHGVRCRIIISFDLADEKFREVLRPECGCLNGGNYHLVALRGCLSAAVYGTCGKLEIWVMKNYGVKESWIKEFKVGNYSPILMDTVLYWSYGIWKNDFRQRIVRILCLLKNGEILLEYRGGTLAYYDPRRQKFRKIGFNAMPNRFQTIVHVGSFNRIS